ncbi:MAG: helix-turn-helix transcriptional regulator [Saprospiraceae bacterium]
MALKLLKKKITVIVEKTNTGFSAYAPDYPVATTGRAIIELQKNILEVLNFYFEDHGYEVTKSNIALQIDLKQFFQYYKVLNSRHLAEKIGMNPTLLSQYVQGRKKPSAQQSERIIYGIQQIGKELAELRLINNV